MSTAILSVMGAWVIARFTQNKFFVAIAALFWGVLAPVINLIFLMQVVFLATVFVDSRYADSFAVGESVIRTIALSIPLNIILSEFFSFWFLKDKRRPGAAFIMAFAVCFVGLMIVTVALNRPIEAIHITENPAGETEPALAPAPESKVKVERAEEIVKKMAEEGLKQVPIKIDEVTNIVSINADGNTLIYSAEVSEASNALSIPDLKANVSKGPCNGKNTSILFSNGIQFMYRIKYLKDNIDVNFSIDKEYCDSLK